MMTIMGNRFTRRGISVVIAALLLIAIAVAAAVLLYVFSIGLLGSLGSSGGQQTKQQLVLEAYNWNTITSLAVNLRNVGSAAVQIGTTDIFLNGISQSSTGPGGSCSGVLTVQQSCTGAFAPTGFTPQGGVAYVLKLVTPDGAVFSYTVIAGQAS
jgi:flagellin-like protein